MLLSVIQVHLYFLFLQLLFEIYLQIPYEKPRQKIRKLNPETINVSSSSSSSSSSSPSHSNCGHWYVRHGTCLSCKKKPSLVESRQFDYLFSDLRLSREAVSFTKRLTTLISLHTHKKLHLVLDLDHTLAHSVRVSNLSEAEKYLITGGEKAGCLKLYEDRIIKVRPFVKAFLKEANKLFNMYVYTKGDLRYGKEIVKMIDPKKTYFGDRVITRRECPDKKTLDHVLADERGIVIVDDTIEVWPHHMRNLLKITKYFYFKHNGIINMSYAERKTDESRSNGAIANLLKFLKDIHNRFFSCDVQEELDSKDVRLLINGPFMLQGYC